MTSQRIMTFEFSITWNGSGEFLVLRAIQPQTDGPDTSRSWMMWLGSSETASNARNFDSPLMKLVWTVAIWNSFHSILPKQMQQMMNETRIQKYFAKWWRIEEVWWIWVWSVLERFWRMWRVFDLNFDELWFCYD